MRIMSLLCLMSAYLSISQATLARSLIRDGGFETPATPAGTHVTYTLGQKLGDWTVVGPSGSNVDLISTSYTEAGFTFTAKSGQASVDLTGAPDDGFAQGVAQTFETTAGNSYKITFWVGNIYDPGGGFGTTSTVKVYVGQNLILSATNSGGAGVSKSVWKKFGVSFVAETAETTLTFINGDLGGVNDKFCGLDNVSVIDDGPRP